MNAETIKEIDKAEELPDSWWYRIYLAVIITTIVVISALGTFTSYFSS
ncbi:MAG: hypothetical protein LC768_12400 [Acidobacteria bacterium]|nr:hypothetical protein [Acidobacteriota bacterium]MCA1639112.1 hypothetical protein [Acidobacteriota bacterium]